MDIASFFRYSSANFENAEFAEPQSMNVLQALNTSEQNSNIDEEYLLRKQLYETKDCFFNNDDIENNTSEQETDEEINQLKENIKKGQTILKNEIQIYSSLREQLDSIGHQREKVHEHIVNIKKHLMMIGDYGTTNEKHKDICNDIHDKINLLDAEINGDLNTQMAAMKDDYTKSFRKLLQLKEVYKFCRQADNTFTCPICMQEPVSSYIMPCGHTFCKDCISNVRARCYICRQYIDKTMNLFFT